VEKDEEEFNELISNKHITHCVEVGFIVHIIDRDINKDIYEYISYGCSILDFHDWEDKIINRVLESENQEYVKTIRWVIEEYGLCKIYRDEEWYLDHLPHLVDFWEEVIEGRKLKSIEKQTPPLLINSSKQIEIPKESLYVMYDSD
jgi:hypothetical protein